jgi:peptidoglycan hydrolase-like protein with peptidoglycan-binding domain
MNRLTAAVAATVIAVVSQSATLSPASARAAATAPEAAVSVSNTVTGSSAHTALGSVAVSDAALVSARSPRERRFAREVVRPGDQDTSTSNIEHVRELQYRLRWAGVYTGPVTGYFGDLTSAAVKRYQRRERIAVTGVASRGTWRHLIPDSTRGLRKVPNACDRGKGWDVCYNRALHQVTLWHGGRLHNGWLVRGGDRGMETRTGHFKVYYRDIDHVSGLYGSPMPYSQFFSGGQALHGSTYMMDPFSGHSHGCVNMYVEDARQLWAITAGVRLGVHVHGRWS